MSSSSSSKEEEEEEDDDDDDEDEEEEIYSVEALITQFYATSIEPFLLFLRVLSTAQRNLLTHFSSEYPSEPCYTSLSF